MPKLACTPSWDDVSDARRAIMRANKGKNTKPEILVRKLLHRMGYRFRLHRRDLPGTPDIALPGRRKIVQVHGCFWHQHEGCRLARVPVTRREFWEAKFNRNKARDARDLAKAQAEGWSTLVIWECEVKDIDSLKPRLVGFLGITKAMDGNIS